ncbi:MAG: hypothetical protein IJQ02_11890 [Oscillospiraceae bacterium]|nr:hypothetical protein [Oscillospiraceae bacterium]
MANNIAKLKNATRRGNNVTETAKSDVGIELPAVSAEDNGKVLAVADGAWAAVEMSTDMTVPVTYAELKALRDAGELVPGMHYHMTDYVCTAVGENCEVVSHPYDIVVTADTESHLNENASACLHEGDSYYADADSFADLGLWELKYCIDNDTGRFSWADAENGKGVVWYLKDEHRNEAYYDFKQIRQKKFKVTSSSCSADLVGQWSPAGASIDGIWRDPTQSAYFYTFCDPSTPDVDASVFSDEVYDNVIYPLSSGILLTMQNVTMGAGCHTNIIGHDCQKISLSNQCSNNQIGDASQNMILGPKAKDNSFGAEGYNIAIGGESQDNHLGEGCQAISLNAKGNTVGETVGWTTIKGNHNEIGSGCSSVNIESGSSDNVVGQGASSITVNGYRNRIGNGCNTIRMTGLCYDNEFGNNCRNITMASGGCYNRFGDGCENNTLGNGCCGNTFGEVCWYITLAAYSNYNTFDTNLWYVRFQGSTAATQEHPAQYYHVLSGVRGTSESLIDINPERDRDYVTFVGYNSSGVLKQYCPMDGAT